MAEFHFYGTHEDWWLYLTTLQTQDNYELVADLWYDTPEFLRFRAISDDIRDTLKKRPHVYLWSPRYSRFQPWLDGTQRPTLIDPRLSGPALDLALPACYQQNGLWCLNFGNLSFENAYCNPLTGEWYKPPEPVKADFVALRKSLQKVMVRRYAHMTQQVYEKKPEIKTVWIGPDAIRKLESGEAQIRIYTDWWKGSELSKTRE